MDKIKTLELINEIINYLIKGDNDYVVEALYQFFVFNDTEQAITELLEIDEVRDIVRKELDV